MAFFRRLVELVGGNEDRSSDDESMNEEEEIDNKSDEVDMNGTINYFVVCMNIC
jgi:hypothetical protein